MKPLFYLVFPLAYLLGSVPFGFLAARLFRGVDIRTVGSGNIGATNAARVLGWRYFPFIFLLDLSKGLVPVLVMRALLDGAAATARWQPSPFVILAGIAAILGHVFPVFLKFKGGKAVATSTGVFITVAPLATFVAFAVWVTLFLIFRYVSLASICAAVTLPLVVTLHRLPTAFGSGLFLTVFCWIGCIFVVFLHRSNIRRLLSGTENRVGRKRPEAPPAGEAQPPEKT